MLALATIGFAVCFWAWALLAPFGPALRDELGLSSFQQSLVVALPVVVGSLGRIPVGALTDRWGARRMFPLVSALTMGPVLYLGHGADSLAGVLVGGFFLGLGGTAFAVGVPFVNAWYPPERRGLALGIFGVGTGGTALSSFSTVQLTDALGRSFPFDLVAAVLAAYSVTAAVLLRDRPGRAVAASPSSTPCPSAASSPSAATSPPTSPPPTASGAPMQPRAPQGSSCWPFRLW